MTHSLYTHLVSGWLFPLHEKLKQHSSTAMRKALEQSQWLPTAQLQQARRDKLARFLTSLNQHNPYYRDLFAERGLAPADFGDSDILQRLPCLDKATIRAHRQQMLSDAPGPHKWMSTSGSSGEPLKFAVGNDRISHDIAAKWRATRWWGVDIGDPEAVIWGSDIELSGQGLTKVVRDRLMRSRLFPAKHLDPEGLKSLLDQLRSYNPAMIYGYPSILYLLADLCSQQGIVQPVGKLKVIFCTAEKLYDHQRALIEAVFKAPVANGYGSRDAGFIAHECPEGRLHLSAEDIIVEILDEELQPVAQGESGEIVVTHLATAAFPMIRYRTGDIGRFALDACPCGRTLPVLSEVVGRANDILTATTGGSVHGAYIGNLIREFAAVRQFQLVQQTPTQFDLKLVCSDSRDLDTEALTGKLRGVLGGDARLNIVFADLIEAQATGKFKYIINNCKAPAPINTPAETVPE